MPTPSSRATAPLLDGGYEALAVQDDADYPIDQQEANEQLAELLFNEFVDIVSRRIKRKQQQPFQKRLFLDQGVFLSHYIVRYEFSVFLWWPCFNDEP